MRDFTLHYLKPSDIRYIEANIARKDFQDALMEKVPGFLESGGQDIASLDTCYCTGVELRAAKAQDVILSAMKQEFDNAAAGTRAAVFYQGLKGQSFNPS